MPDRLAELRRQRALLQEHLAWLDAEIARESGGSSAATMPSPLTGISRNPFGPLPPLAASAVVPATRPPQPQPAGTTPGATRNVATPAIISGTPTPAAAAAATPEIEAMLDEYRVPPTSVRTDVRKGCFLYFAAALALVALVVTVLYFALTPR